MRRRGRRKNDESDEELADVDSSQRAAGV